MKQRTFLAGLILAGAVSFSGTAFAGMNVTLSKTAEIKSGEKLTITASINDGVNCTRILNAHERPAWDRTPPPPPPPTPHQPNPPRPFRPHTPPPPPPPERPGPRPPRPPRPNDFDRRPPQDYRPAPPNMHMPPPNHGTRPGDVPPPPPPPPPQNYRRPEQPRH